MSYWKTTAVMAAFLAFGLAACEGDEGGPTHNAGRDCSQSGCHSFAYSGTVYSDLNGSAAVNGATVTVTENDGTVRTFTSNSVGNFYSNDGNPGSGYTVSVSSPDGSLTYNMASSASIGGCNNGNCHNSSLRIYAPNQ